MSDTELLRRVIALEKRLDELVEPEVGRWVDWTPTITQGVAVTATVNFARYITIDKAVVVVAALDITSAGTGGSVISIGGIPTIIQPANIDATGIGTIGTAIVQNLTAVTNYVGALIAFGVSDWRVVSHLNAGWVGNLPNFAFANGDSISFMAAYER